MLALVQESVANVMILMWCLYLENYKWCCPELQRDILWEMSGEKHDAVQLEDQEMENTKERELVWVSDQRMETVKRSSTK